MNFPHASKTFKALNPEYFRADLGAVSPAQPQPAGYRPAPRAHPPQGRRPRRLVVCLVSFRRRLLDDDNHVGACKYLRDAIAATIGLDDADPRLRFEYAQCRTTGPEGVLVKISNSF